QPGQLPARAPMSRARKAVLITGIVAASSGILAGIGVGIYALVNAAAEGFEAIVPPVLTGEQVEPLLRGEPGSPLALEPVECPEECFTNGHVSATIIDRDELQAVGLTETVDT